MENSELAPLGYADLTGDEAFIVTVFRHWQMIGPTHAVAERRLCMQLRKDQLYDGFVALFEIFRNVPLEEGRTERNSSGVLSAAEEMLLEVIGSADGVRSASVAEFQRVLHLANVRIRPASGIPRSGHDKLVDQIDCKSAVVQQMLYMRL
ncbi:MAG: hypothetical protein AAGC70_04570 [Pseudomonadota bacterium]